MSAPAKAATIVAYLANNGGWYRVDEIARGVGMADSYVRERLKALQREGLVERRTYTLKYSGGESKNTKLAEQPQEQWRKVA